AAALLPALPPSCALLPPLSLEGSAKSNCLGRGGRGRMKLTCAEAAQQTCTHLQVCMSVKLMEAHNIVFHEKKICKITNTMSNAKKLQNIILIICLLC
uniref:Uncharacterized protein n=1 Tax=Salarias fasciatus TaxID=181472 RepID=A0A672F1G8_SALFA